MPIILPPPPPPPAPPPYTFLISTTKEKTAYLRSLQNAIAKDIIIDMRHKKYRKTKINIRFECQGNHICVCMRGRGSL